MTNEEFKAIKERWTGDDYRDDATPEQAETDLTECIQEVERLQEARQAIPTIRIESWGDAPFSVVCCGCGIDVGTVGAVEAEVELFACDTPNCWADPLRQEYPDVWRKTLGKLLRISENQA